MINCTPGIRGRLTSCGVKFSAGQSYQAIEAWEKATIADIKAKRDDLINYLECSFDQRAKNFNFLFKKVHEAIAIGDNNQLALAMTSITEIAKSSLFKDIADLTSVRAALDDPDHEGEF